MKADNDNHAEIYLQPPGTAEAPEGRLWCQDDAPFDCEDDDGNVVPWVKYVRSDIHDALAARMAEMRQAMDELHVKHGRSMRGIEQLEARLAECERTFNDYWQGATNLTEYMQAMLRIFPIPARATSSATGVEP